MKCRAARLANLTSVMVVIIIFMCIIPTTYAKAHNSSTVKTIKLWHYKNGISPVDNDYLPDWSRENFQDYTWNYSETPPLVSNRADSELWTRFRIEDENTSNFAIYFEKIMADSIEVYINNKSVYKSDTVNSNKGDNILSNIIIPLGDDYHNKVMTVRMVSANNRLIGIDGQVYTGEYKDITKEVLGINIYGVVIGVFFIILSMTLFIVTMYFKEREKKALLSFGLAVFTTGVWNLVGLNNTNILLPDKPLILLYIYNVASMVTPVAFAYFYENTFASGYKLIVKRVRQAFQIYSASFIALFTVYLLSDGKFFSFIMSSFISYLYYVLLIVEVSILFINSVRFSFKGNKEAKIFTLGASILTISVILYSLNYIVNKERSFIVVIGILFFILSLVLILARRFIIDHKQLQKYSKELEAKNKDLNKMWIEIKKSKDEIAKWNRTLEFRVKERTQQLQESNKELQEALDKLNKTQDQLIQSEKYAALGELVASIAHEINTPVGIGVTAASYLSEKTNEFAKIYNENKMKRSDLENYINTCIEASESILPNLQRAAGLIKSFKQVAVDQSSEEIRYFNIKEYMDEILLNLRPKLKRTKHRINVICEDDIMIESYPGAISQVMTNLIMNSLTHAYCEEENGVMEIEITKVENQLIIRYSDDGKGIPKANMDKIYDPFFTTKRGGGGTGLGLNIVYNIISQMLGGTIQCESNPGEGTTFIISIPVEKGDIYEA